MSPEYELIEPEKLDEVLLLQDRACSLALLQWLVAEVSSRYEHELGGARLTVVRAEYNGPYPCLAIQQPFGRGTEAVSELVKEAVERLLAEAPLSDFVRFLVERDGNWSLMARNLMKPPE